MEKGSYTLGVFVLYTQLTGYFLLASYSITNHVVQTVGLTCNCACMACERRLFVEFSKTLIIWCARHVILLTATTYVIVRTVSERESA